MGSQMNRTHGKILAILSLAATAGVPLLLLLVRMKAFTFHEDYTGFNALGFVFTWAFVLLVTGVLLGALACYADRRSWLARSALGINGALLAWLIWLLAKMG